MLRSPHAHAKILSIDTRRKALKVDGVKAVITNADFPELRTGGAGDIAKGQPGLGQGAVSWPWRSRRRSHHRSGCPQGAEEDQSDLRAAASRDRSGRSHGGEDAPILDETLGYEGHEGPSNIYEHVEQNPRRRGGRFRRGGRGAGANLHHAHRSPGLHRAPACLASFRYAGQSTIWTTTQGHFAVRDSVALMCGMPTHELKVIPTEIGGGFGGKTTPYLEAIALHAVEARRAAQYACACRGRRSSGLPGRVRRARSGCVSAP